MKQLMISLALFVYGTAALAYNTVIVNDTPYRATLRYNDNPNQFCQIHGHNNPQCNGKTINLEPKKGVQIVNHERIDLYTFEVNDWQLHNNQVIFEIQKTLLPFQQLERQALDNQSNDLIVSRAKKKHDVIINLKLIELPNGLYTLYLEEPRLFRNKDVRFADPYPYPIIVSHNAYGNQYGHYHGGYNPYGHGFQPYQQYHHNYGGGGYNAYGHGHQPNLNQYGDNYGHGYHLNPNQYGHNYGGGYY